MQNDRLNHRLWLWGLFLGFVFAYASVQNVGYFDASDSYSRFHMMKSLLGTGSPHWMTPNTTEPQVCLNSLGPALSPLPFQAVGYVLHFLHLADGTLEQVLVRSTLMANVVYTALWMCLVAVLAVQLGATRLQGSVLALVVGFGTLVFPYTKTAQGENQIGLCLTGIVLLLLRLDGGEKIRYPLGIGLLFSFMIVSKTELLAVGPLLFLAVGGLFSRRGWGLASWRSMLVFSVGVLPGLLLILWYNFVRFGSVWSSGHLGDQHGESLLKPFSHPFWAGLYIQLFSPGKGIVWYCPVLLVCLPFVFRLLRGRPRVLWVPYIWWVMMTCVYAKWYSPAGDTALGSRFQVSYLGFAVLPLLGVFSLDGSRRRIAAWVVGGVAVSSVVLQVVFCLVSFNVDFHRQIEGLEPLEKFERVYAQYYGLKNSLLWGFFRTLSEGFLDLNFLRYRPLESGLVVMPALWWLVGGALCAFGVTGLAAKGRLGAGKRRAAVIGQVPAVFCFVLAVGRFGYPSEVGLELTMSNPHSGAHVTVVKDIDIGNLNDGREVYKIDSPFRLKWKGRVYCAEPGGYVLRSVSDRSLAVRLSDERALVEAGAHSVEFSMDSPGWKRFEVECAEGYMFDAFRILMRGPGDGDFLPLAEWRLAH